MRFYYRLALIISMAVAAAPVVAGQADVLKLTAEKTGRHSYRFAATVRHADSGWSHYADRWEILGPEDKILATRVLHHPHVDEQPFTRSLGSIKLPPNLTWVRARAHDKKHGYGGRRVTISLPQE
ncbi:MAG: hypothetical protein RPU32_11710 [Candidatus Sedimenticola sp. (ex Thyasira tokunagai)]